jgi:hypothetical protein
LLIALPARYAIERIKPFDKTDRNPQWTKDLKKLNERPISRGVLFNYDNPIEAMFYTNLTVYQHIPEIGILNNLQQKGYTILINDKGNIPVNIRTMQGITVLNLQSPSP